jgi:hypothetical protein
MDAKSTLVEMAQQEDTLPTQQDRPEPKLQNEDDSLHILSGQIILEAYETIFTSFVPINHEQP